MSREKARELVLCLVFEKSCRREQSCESLYDYMFEELAGDLFENGDVNDSDKKYIKRTFAGVFEHAEQIDGVVSDLAVGWEYSRISKISAALLRIAGYEILYAGDRDVPVSVAINEAVKLSKIYDDPGAYAFVNGILAAVAKKNKT